MQLVLELIAIAGADPASPRSTGTLFEVVQRLDGVKMLALAALAAAACAASRHGTLSPMSFLSLPLLLIWVAVLGAALGRR